MEASKINLGRFKRFPFFRVFFRAPSGIITDLLNRQLVNEGFLNMSALKRNHSRAGLLALMLDESSKLGLYLPGLT
jgi:hypothetical protein